MNAQTFFSHLRAQSVNLTDDQRQAVSHADGPLAVYAGPGSGKTTVIACRAAYLHRVADVPAQNIVIFTFTKKSALELTARLGALDTSLSSAVAAGTFHAIFLKWLMRYGGENPRIWSERDRRLAVIEILRSLRLSTDEDSLLDWLRRLSVAKSTVVDPAEGAGTPGDAKERDSGPFSIVTARYEARKREAGGWDFDDILVEFLRRMRTDAPFARKIRSGAARIMIDEFQDTSPVEWAVIEQIGTLSGQVAVVGDDDQSIYGFRGAQPEVLERFLKVWPHAAQVVLRRNFRSTDPIILLSSRLIAHNRARKDKDVSGVSGAGVRPTFRAFRDEWREGRAVALSVVQAISHGATVGVLARTHQQLAAVAENLWWMKSVYDAPGLINSVYGGRHAQAILRRLRSACFDHPAETIAAFDDFARWRGTVAAMRSRDVAHTPDLETLERLFRRNRQTDFLALVHEFRRVNQELSRLPPGDAVAAVRAEYEPCLRRRLRYPAASGAREGMLELARLEDRARAESSLPQWLTGVQEFTVRRGHSEQARIQLLTFHGAKGLEFDHVHVIGLHGLALPHERALRGVCAKDRAAALEEERRLLYVAVTRARSELFLSAPATFAQKPVSLSPFLAEIGLGRATAPRGTDPADTRKAERASTRPDLPIVGEPLVHPVFGCGRVHSLERMRDNIHKIGVLFNGQDIRYFAWEAAVRLGHLSCHPKREGGSALECNDL